MREGKEKDRQEGAGNRRKISKIKKNKKNRIYKQNKQRKIVKREKAGDKRQIMLEKAPGQEKPHIVYYKKYKKEKDSKL